jgi:hypothetical protein
LPLAGCCLGFDLPPAAHQLTEPQPRHLPRLLGQRGRLILIPDQKWKIPRFFSRVASRFWILDFFHKPGVVPAEGRSVFASCS